MNYRKIFAGLLIVLALFTGCRTTDVSRVADADGSYTSTVFDTSRDQGKLTARYLALKDIYNSPEDKINAGDCTVFTSPEGLVMMIDCSNVNSFDEIDAQLRRMNVSQIDIFVMSHPHADHIGCFPALAEKYPIGHVYKNSHEYSSGTYAKVMSSIKEHNIPCTVLNDGDSFKFGNSVEVTVYSPLEGSEERAAMNVGEANNCSLAMKLTYGDSSFWSSGDLYISGEEEVVARHGDEIDSDIMKMNHHGYDTSNGNAFIAAISPKVAVAQHESITSQTVGLRYSLKFGALTFYNCQDGAVSVSTPGDGTYDIQCERIREKTFYGEPAADCHYMIGADK